MHLQPRCAVSNYFIHISNFHTCTCTCNFYTRFYMYKVYMCTHASVPVFIDITWLWLKELFLPNFPLTTPQGIPVWVQVGCPHWCKPLEQGSSPAQQHDPVITIIITINNLTNYMYVPLAFQLDISFPNVYYVIVVGVPVSRLCRWVSWVSVNETVWRQRWVGWVLGTRPLWSDEPSSGLPNYQWLRSIVTHLL